MTIVHGCDCYFGKKHKVHEFGCDQAAKAKNGENTITTLGKSMTYDYCPTPSFPSPTRVSL